MVRMPNQSRIVIGVAGRICSGKSMVAHCLEQDLGFQYLRYSMILAEWFHTDPTDKLKLQEVGGDVMAGDGQRELNRRLVEHVQPGRDVAVDGLRHPIDYECLRKEFSERFFMVFVDTSPTIRFERCRSRYGTFEQFLESDSRPVEANIDSLRPMASTTISGMLPTGALLPKLRTLADSFRKRVER